MPNPLSNVMSAKSKELLVELLASVFKDHIELVLEEYTGMEMTPTMQVRLQEQLDKLVQMWVEYDMVNGDFRLHANYKGNPPMLDTRDPISKVPTCTMVADAVEDLLGTKYLQTIPDMVGSIQEGLATPIEECSTELDWGD